MRILALLSSVVILLAACKKDASTAKSVVSKDAFTESTTASDQYMFLTEQSQNRYGFVNVTQNVWWWTWKAGINNNIPASAVSWFDGPNDIKPVFNQSHVIICGQGGGVAIVRISDKTAVFYAHYSANIHSVEILPDGNLVAACIGPATNGSTDSLVVFSVGASNFPNNVYRKAMPFPGVHNCVWDRTRNCLWAAGTTVLRKITYNFNCTSPMLNAVDSVFLPVQPGNAHELFPVYGKDSLHLSTGGKVWYVDVKNVILHQPKDSMFRYIKDLAGIKSISSGPAGYKTVVQKCLNDSMWWNDEIDDITNLTPVYQESGTKIYKGRWKVNNSFSYPDAQAYTVCH